jgi:hypothetical protein
MVYPKEWFPWANGDLGRKLRYFLGEKKPTWTLGFFGARAMLGHPFCE